MPIKFSVFLTTVSLLFFLAHCEINEWKLQEEYPSNCTTSQYFDTRLLNCQPCPPYTSSSAIDRK